MRLLIFLLVILIPACVFSSPAFLMMYSAYKLNKFNYPLRYRPGSRPATLRVARRKWPWWRIGTKRPRPWGSR